MPGNYPPFLHSSASIVKSTSVASFNSLQDDDQIPGNILCAGSSSDPSLMLDIKTATNSLQDSSNEGICAVYIMNANEKFPKSF